MEVEHKMGDEPIETKATLVSDGISLQGLDLAARMARFKEYYRDQDGNKVIFTKRKHFRRVDLYLPKNSYKKMRCIGRISEKKGKTIYRVQKYLVDHRYREKDSIGFNSMLINEVLDDETTILVKVKDIDETRETTVKDLKEKGEYRYYKKNGLECQIFLGLHHFNTILK